MINLYTEFVRLMNKNFGNSIIHEHIFSDNFLRFIIIVLNLNIICNQRLQRKVWWFKFLNFYTDLKELYILKPLLYLSIFPPYNFQ